MTLPSQLLPAILHHKFYFTNPVCFFFAHRFCYNCCLPMYFASIPVEDGSLSFFLHKRTYGKIENRVKYNKCWQPEQLQYLSRLFIGGNSCKNDAQQESEKIKQGSSFSINKNINPTIAQICQILHILKPL